MYGKNSGVLGHQTTQVSYVLVSIRSQRFPKPLKCLKVSKGLKVSTHTHLQTQSSIMWISESSTWKTINYTAFWQNTAKGIWTCLKNGTAFNYIEFTSHEEHAKWMCVFSLEILQQTCEIEMIVL